MAEQLAGGLAGVGAPAREIARDPALGIGLPDDQRSRFRETAEPIDAAAERFLETFACRDVLHAAFVVERLAVGVADDADVFRDPDLAPVFPLHLVFEIIDDAFLLEQALEFGALFRPR